MRPRFTSAGWFLTGLFTSALVLLPRPAAPQFTSFSHDSRNILEGSWQSCRGDDGRYSERVYDHVVNGTGQFEVHLGPQNEFAIFTGVQNFSSLWLKKGTKFVLIRVYGLSVSEAQTKLKAAATNVLSKL